MLGVLLALSGFSLVGSVAFLTSPRAEPPLKVERRQASTDNEGGERVAEEEVAEGSRRGSSPGAAGPAAPSGAKEVDRPGDHSYTSSRVSCSQHTLLTDSVKDIGSEVDRQLRRGTALSAAEERKIGDKYIDKIEKVLKGRLVRSGRIVRYLEAVAAPMLEWVERKDVKYSFYLLEDTEVSNALALPGGHVVMTRPMLDSTPRNEAQLAAILGHEIAHVDERHPIAVVQYARALGLSEDDQITTGLLSFAQMPYSSKLEEEADALGAAFEHRSGYSVMQAVDLWERMAGKRSGSRPDGAKRSGQDLFGVILDQAEKELESMVSSHPRSESRACRLRQEAHELFSKYPKDRVYVGETNFQKRTAMRERAW